MWKLLIALLFLVTGSAYASEAREVGDAVAKYVLANDNVAIRDRFAPSVRASIPPNELTAISARLRSAFGNPRNVVYWRTLKGFKQRGTTRIPITVVWYRLTTDKPSENLALTVTLMEEGGSLYLEGYSFMQDMGRVDEKTANETGASGGRPHAPPRNP